MSYVVHLWEHPRPTSLAAAERQHQYLSDRASLPNAKWQQLRDAIEARMVAQGTPREWIEYPIDPGHRKRSQGLDFHGPENYQEVVVECATKLGFSVYDDQAARLYLPFGYVLTFDGLSRLDRGDGGLPAPALVPADRDAVMAQCEAAWRPRFEALGWRFVRGEPFRSEIPLVAERTVPVGTQSITISFSTFEERLSVDVVAAIVPHLPEAVLEALGGARRIQVRGREFRGIAALMVDLERGPDMVHAGGTLRNAEYVERLIPGLFEYLDDEVLPVLQACTTPAAILHAASHPDEGPAELLPTRLPLALAWCESDSALEHFYAAYDQALSHWDKDWAREAWETLRALPRGAVAA
jgi:hypothetical protein